jgi:competence ComEA-like helix-hairpin-helix protein
LEMLSRAELRLIFAAVLAAALAAAGIAWYAARKEARVERHPPARLDVNAATAAELESLPGMTPVKSAAVVKHRGQHGPFRKVEDLGAVRGIDAEDLKRWEPFLRAHVPEAGVKEGP